VDVLGLVSTISDSNIKHHTSTSRIHCFCSGEAENQLAVLADKDRQANKNALKGAGGGAAAAARKGAKVRAGQHWRGLGRTMTAVQTVRLKAELVVSSLYMLGRS
jgi:hypothetical protein